MELGDDFYDVVSAAVFPQHVLRYRNQGWARRVGLDTLTDEEWIDRIDYDVDPHRAAPFYAGVRRWWPELPDGALEPDYAGVRAKVQAPGEPMRDFVVHGPAEHGMPGLVNLFGIESPGLTASLALADEVVALL